MTRKQKKNLIRIIISVPLLIAALVLRRVLRLPPWAEALLFAPAYMVVGIDVLIKAFKNIINGQVFDENLLMSIATIGAFAIGEYPEAAAVMLLYQIGELFQSIAVGRSRRSIAALMDIRPDHANVLRGTEECVSPDEVDIGEIIIIRSGERIPLDGVIIEGSTTLDTAALTGESMPRECGEGENVISGTVNIGSVIKVRTTSRYENSTVARILELVENASSKKAVTENFITKFARFYTPTVVISAMLLAVIPPLLFGAEWTEWIRRALIFLIVSCPCALVISVPLTFFCGMGGASKSGILVKGSTFIEALAHTGTIVFDKTGTLTSGSFNVSAVHTNGMTEAELLDIAALAESFSNHPIAQSIVRAHSGHISPERVSDVKELAGFGISALIDGARIFAGSEKLMESIGVIPICHDGCAECCSGTCVHIASESSYLGHILISDEIKRGSHEAIERLSSMDIRTVMLTGDSQAVGTAVGSALGIDDIHSELLPNDKVDMVESMLDTHEKRRLVFVGDGINDAPALGRADVGIAMGALGSDAAIEAADIVLTDDDPAKIPTAVNIAKRTMRIVWQNIVFALAIKLAVLVLGALGYADMWISVFADVGVSVLAILNAVRAARRI